MIKRQLLTLILFVSVIMPVYAQGNQQIAQILQDEIKPIQSIKKDKENQAIKVEEVETITINISPQKSLETPSDKDVKDSKKAEVPPRPPIPTLGSETTHDNKTSLVEESSNPDFLKPLQPDEKSEALNKEGNTEKVANVSAKAPVLDVNRNALLSTQQEKTYYHEDIDTAKLFDNFIYEGRVKPSAETLKKQAKQEQDVLSGGIAVEKIPVGTKLNIEFNNYISAKTSQEGDAFSATIVEDVSSGESVILPAGTLIRGRVGDVKKPGIFSKSGAVKLDFDHIITPLGKQIALDVDLSEANKTNKKGALIASPGFKGEVKQNFSQGVDITKKTTGAGYRAGMKAGVVPVVATVPVTAVAGSVAGSAVFVSKSAIAIFKKGGNPIIQSGDTLEIDFSDDIDLPVN